MPKFDIAGHRRIFFLISLILIIPGFICMGVRGFNFGIDFTGGTIIDLHFEHPVTLADIRTSLAKYDLDNSTIQLSGTESGVESSENAMIRTVDLEENQRKEVMAALAQDVGPYTVLREEKVGATIGGELITNAVLALVISWALIILYVAYRFEWRFGVSAVLALVHDIIIVLAVFSLTQRQIDSSFIAALLTIVGYSINDTIVIFDRIREAMWTSSSTVPSIRRLHARSTRSSPFCSQRRRCTGSAARRRRTSHSRCSLDLRSDVILRFSLRAKSGLSCATVRSGDLPRQRQRRLPRRSNKEGRACFSLERALLRYGNGGRPC